MTARVRLSVPTKALGGVTETLLRVGVAAAVLEHLGQPAVVELDDAGPEGIHLVPGPHARVGAATTDALVQALASWLDDVLGPTDPRPARRASVELEIPVSPQLPQGNPLVGRGRRVTPVTSWG